MKGTLSHTSLQKNMKWFPHNLQSDGTISNFQYYKYYFEGFLYVNIFAQRADYYWKWGQRSRAPTLSILERTPRF